MTFSQKSKIGVELKFTYDALGRTTGVIDPRTGASATHYNAKGRVDYVEDAAGNRTRYVYDPASGRKILEIDPLDKETRYLYNDRGQTTHTWGDAPYPLKRVYDAYGRLSEMHTYRGDSNWDSAMWPTGATGPSDVTEWRYHEATGLLTAKVYADGNRTRYTYTEGGKLETRIWARLVDGSPLTTIYTNDPDTGELLGVDYSDDTPDISFTYDRLGRNDHVSDAVGSRDFLYNEALQQESETTSGLLDYTISRKYESDGLVGRSIGFSFDADYDVSYGYDDVGRFETVSWAVGGVSRTAAYDYLPDSDLIERLTTPDGLRTSYTYEPRRNLKTRVKNEFGDALISQYDYTYDELGRRQSVLNSGSVFAEPAFNHYTYNDRNELTESSRYLGADISDTSNPVQPEYRGYEYDPIGNRIEYVEATDTIGYSTNELNQYTSLTGPALETLIYDADGNLTSRSSGVKYIYDAENRLIAVAPQNPVEGEMKVEFVYDYMGRRAEKRISKFVSGAWSLTSEILFIWNGWNLVCEKINTPGQAPIDKYYVWGLDLSRSLQGAGGIGGLLASIEGVSSKTLYFSYDGLGHVGQLINANKGDIAAHYKYDPYGNIIVSAGSESEKNPFRFSTKYFDPEVDLYYFGYRYYATQLSRWITRDPIEENGGINIYCYVRNDTINGFDPSGLFHWIDIFLVNNFYTAPDSWTFLSYVDLSEYSDVIRKDSDIQYFEDLAKRHVKRTTEEYYETKPVGDYIHFHKQTYSGEPNDTNIGGPYITEIYSFGRTTLDISWDCSITVEKCRACSVCDILFSIEDEFKDPVDAQTNWGWSENRANLGGTPFSFGLKWNTNFEYVYPNHK